MPSQHRKDLLQQRRRARADGDDEASVANEVYDDSASEASLPSDADEDADADYSDLSEGDVPETSGSDIRRGKIKTMTKHRSAHHISTKEPIAIKKSKSQQAFQPVKDTEVMLNGLTISDNSGKAETLDFDTVEKEGDRQSTESTKPKPETSSEKKIRENEEYKRKLESDPAFIPTRGAFFMHDHRNHSPGNNGFRVMRGGRGRGRNGPTGPYPPSMPNSQEPTNSQWSHDLHETLLEPQSRAGANVGPHGPINDAVTSAASKLQQPPPPRSFSTTQLLGKVPIRVSLPGMKEPKSFPDQRVNRYTKLPNHRPPLRRDKPVRVFLPYHPVRYIFPALDRSFIFIPRNLRPNQQGFGRGRGKGLGSMGGFSSRRTSIYGGSMYSPSVAMSRRSSIARDSMMASPAGSMMGSRPVVRLPPGSHHPTGSVSSIHGPNSSTGTPVMVGPGPFAPPRPAYRENWPTNLQVHQPRPQKTISVTGIEIPAATHTDDQPAIPMDQLYAAPQQPFHHQIPQQINGAAPDTPGYTHSRQQSYPVQPSGTPLSNIPDRAIHAQPFQPYPQAGAYPTSFNNQPAYYYPPPPGAYPPGAVMAPVFVPQHAAQQPYMMPATMPAPQNAASGVAPSANPQGPNPMSSMVAHEQNGMVYYYDPSQLPPAPEGYSQGAYPMPVMPGMMGQAPDGYFYPPTGAMYYPPQ